MELEPKVLRDERQRGILCCPNLVPSIRLRRIAVLILEFVGQVKVEVQFPRVGTMGRAINGVGIGIILGAVTLSEGARAAGCPLLLVRRAAAVCPSNQ